MDIKTINIPAPSGRSSDPGKPATGEAAINRPSTPEDAGSNVDKVTLTDVQRQLRTLEHKAEQVNAENSERIAKLREAINNGSYKIDAEKVADKLMQTEALLSRI